MRSLARPTAIAVCLGLGLAGCQVVPGDGPWMGAAQGTNTETLPFDVIELTPTSVMPYKPAASIDIPSGMGSVSFGGRVAVAPGDVLRIRIFEPYEGSIFPTLKGPGSDLGPQRVTDDGTINVPFVGTIRVAGLDLTQIERRIISQIGNKAQDPQVIVDFAADRTHTVMVSGDVRNPGHISILEGVRSIVDAINRAGGAGAGGGGGAGGGSNTPASQLEVVVRRNGQIILLAQYAELLAGADIPIQKGDEIVVRPNVRNFTALGAVLKAGNYEIMRPTGYTLLEALGQVGGLSDERANKTGVFVFRFVDPEVHPNVKSTVFRLDLSQPASIFIAQQFGIRPRDVVYVTNAPLYEYNKILTAVFRTFTVVSVIKRGVAGDVPASVEIVR